MNEILVIDRPPRIQPVLPFDTVEIPPPPERKPGGLMRLVQVGLPLLTIIGFLLMSTTSSSGRSPLFMIPMALAVVASTAFAGYTHFREKREQAERERSYAAHMVELSREMRTQHDLQRRFYSYNYPDHATTLRIVREARFENEKAERTLRAGSRLWERRVDDDDFGLVRLGMGTLPSTVLYTVQKQSELEVRGDPLARTALKLQEDSRFVPDIPVVVSLRPPRESQDDEEPTEAEKQVQETRAGRTPATHSLGIAGDREPAYEFTRALLTQYLAFHAPIDARLHVLASRREEWAWTEGVPHCQDDHASQVCFLDSVEASGKEAPLGEGQESPLGQYLEGLRRVLVQRRLQLGEREESGSSGDPTLPFMLLVVDLTDAAYDERSPLRELESDPAISILLAEGNELGAAAIFLVPERSKVPSGCHSVVEIERTTSATSNRTANLQRLHFRYAEIGVNTFRYVGEADHVAVREDMDSLAERLDELEVRPSYGAELTNYVPFLPLMGASSMEHLLEQVRHNWSESIEPGRADWLRARIGLMSGNKPRTLAFSAKRDGVHGMVAGATGSGKSELLISLIASMAVTYDPSVLNFVLVDYKGGGAFQGFEELPHCVDIITNLGGEGVTRMFTAINAELQRRQRLNADTGTKNIVDYRQRGLHKAYAPYPFLFIIIDEFAEMIADRAEFKAQLETITRVGRAQGVSLILAAQRPSGVTDQMRSNIKFRICLRVETTSESQEMLRRADAAFLPSGVPGRGFLQIGNEEIDPIQVAYSGEEYIDPALGERRPVIWPDRGDTYNPADDQEPPELYRAIVQKLAKLAHELDVPEQNAPWPGFLPDHLSLSSPLASEDRTVQALSADRYLAAQDVAHMLMGTPREPVLSLNPSVARWLNDGEGWVEPMNWARFAMRPVIGLVDDPFSARNLPLIVNLQRGHAAVFGASGWGKTTFLRTLVLSLAATHSPDCVNFYLLDLGGRSLAILEQLPHVGAVINPDEEGYWERVEQLLREMRDIVDQRKEILSTAGVQDIQRYNAAHPAGALPAMLVAIDNFTEFQESFGGGDDPDSAYHRFLDLAREGRAYGVHLVVTANQVSALPSQLYNLFTERFTLKLTDATEYRGVVGGSVADLPDIPGRGYFRVDRLPLSFQVATLLDPARSGHDEAVNENAEIRQLAGNMRAFMERSEHAYSQPLTVGALPKSVLFRQILARQHGLELDGTFLDRLREITRQKWARSTEPKEADWLRVTFGLVSGNRLREMQLEAKRDGVHGLIAGGTGSGKSEMLMTLIVGLALNYDPSVLNFVLVDYKGGGAFKPFETLPHCVDSISNLNKAAVQRMFKSINAEMRRRQKLNADTGTKDIVEYRARGYHLSREPYPHLFIIIDEYAEMITESPEFKAELESITRVGRAQGVNLLLASQRPTGVSGQMRANIKFRLCLRVEERETSREMLLRTDAAFLPSGMPGRGYLQVGNENLELMQVAYTGEPYPYADTGEGGGEPKFYDVVVDLAKELRTGETPRTPWPPFLPKAMTFSDPLVEAYMPTAYRSLITPAGSGSKNRSLTLNPLLQAWLDGQGAWPGISWDRHAMRGIAGLVDDPSNARQIPLVVDLTKGHGVIFGGSGWGKSTFLRSLVLSLAATHSPDEFHAHVLDLGGRGLEPLATLPHLGTLIMPDEQGYEERVQQLLREINDVIDSRKALFSQAGVSTLYEYNEQAPDRPEPAILIAIDNFAEFVESFGGKEGDPNNLLEALVAVVRQAKAYGIHFVITASRLNILSAKLYSLFTERFTLRLPDAGDYGGIVGRRIDDIDEIPGRGYTQVDRQALEFQVALPPGAVAGGGGVRGEPQQIRAIGKRMSEYLEGAAHHYREPLRVGALPKTSSYRQVLAEEFGISREGSFMAGLQAAMRARWAENRLAEQADWLKVPIGITSGNRTRWLQLEAKRDGVHGMIAGGTGSGKSELLMTLIVGLATNYPPDLLNLVLVDYKGGGAFRPFEQLPHCVDIVTNLNKAAVDRMFTSINAEIRRRQSLNADTGTKDIVEYRRRGLHLTREPYPHLFIIIDEYAEMIDDNPEYRSELESITRVGRAQGVHLLLASQRPKGVTDQMRANIKLRLCLRVEQAETSRELLQRPDAALLPSGLPGRGYLQVGNENLELIQVSYTGMTQPDDREAAVEWPQKGSVAGNPLEPADDQELPKLFDAIVTLSAELVGDERVPKPWPPFLPTQISLQTPFWDTQAEQWRALSKTVTDWLNGETGDLWPGINWREQALRPALGLVDDPAEARQYPLHLDLRRGHLSVFGDSGWGKTTFLRSLIVSLASQHSPDELHLHVLDLAGRSFRSLEKLPHVGAMIYADEESFEERLQRLLAKLNQMVDARMQLLSAEGAANMFEFNERFKDRAMPAVVVLIDSFAPLQEDYELLVDQTLVPLLRRSLAAGLVFVVTANDPSGMPRKLRALLSEQLTFRQSNPDRYLDIVGRGAIDFDEIQGRGYLRSGRRPLLFQAALPVGALTDPEGLDLASESEELQLFARNMVAEAASATRSWRTEPDPVPILPETVSLRDMLERVESPRKNRIETTLGLGGDLLPVALDLRRMPSHFAIVGPPLSGKTSTLYAWLFSLAYRYSPDQVAFVLVDFQQRFADYGGAQSLEALPHVVAVIREIEELEALLPALKAEAASLAGHEPVREVFCLIDNFDDASDEIETKRGLAQELALLARRHGRDGLHFVIAGPMAGTATELRRRITSAGLGVGLQSESALDALRVTRRPARLGVRELPVGRGYLVRSGQPSLIQIANPYAGFGNGASPPEDVEDEEYLAQALDAWVALIAARFPGKKATLGGEPAPIGTGDAPALERSQGERAAGRELLQRALKWEADRLTEVADSVPVVITTLARTDAQRWEEEQELGQILRAVWREEKKTQGLPEDTLQSLLELLDDDSLVMEVTEFLPDLGGDNKKT